MTKVNKTVCDGPGCSDERDDLAYGGPSYYQFVVGFGSNVRSGVYDFCSVDCLNNWIRDNSDNLK